MVKFRHLKAYIVDDEEVDLYIIQRIIKLKNLAGKIELYRTGDELIEALKNTAKKPDYVLLNFRLSSENGLEIMERIQHLNLKTPDRPPYFVITSSTADLSDLNTINSDRNIDGFLYKPLAAINLNHFLNSRFG